MCDMCTNKREQSYIHHGRFALIYQNSNCNNNQVEAITKDATLSERAGNIGTSALVRTTRTHSDSKAAKTCAVENEFFKNAQRRQRR